MYIYIYIYTYIHTYTHNMNTIMITLTYTWWSGWDATILLAAFTPLRPLACNNIP